MPKEPIISSSLPAPKGPYSPAIKVDGFLFVSGQGPLDLSTGEPNLGSTQIQTELALKNVQAILEAAGSSLDKVVKTTVYLTDIADFKAMNEVYATFFPSAPPARTAIQAAALPLGISVEIDAIALA